MVILTRRELNRIRTGTLLGLLLGLGVLVGVARSFSAGGPTARFLLILIGLAALATVALSIVALIAYRGPSKAILFHQPDQMVIATNQIHDGYKLRFFRDMLNDNIVHFTDGEREEWSALKSEGFQAVFKIRNARKTQILPMLFLLFDQVYVLDHTNRWDYFNCQHTSEPTYSERGVGPLSDESVLPQAKRQPAT